MQPEPQIKPFELLLEKANFFLDSLSIDFGDPQTSESEYFQAKKSSAFHSKDKTLILNQNNSVRFQSSLSETAKSTSELLNNRLKMKKLPLIKSSAFSSPQTTKRQILRKKPSIEDFTEALNNDSLLSFDLSEDDENEKTTQPSLTLDLSKAPHKKRLSLFSTFLMRDTLEDLDRERQEKN